MFQLHTAIPLTKQTLHEHHPGVTALKLRIYHNVHPTHVTKTTSRWEEDVMMNIYYLGAPRVSSLVDHRHFCFSVSHTGEHLLLITERLPPHTVMLDVTSGIFMLSGSMLYSLIHHHGPVLITLYPPLS